jgi:hypothetical protein
MNVPEQAPASAGLELDRIFHAYGDTPVVDGVSMRSRPVNWSPFSGHPAAAKPRC